MLPRLKQEGKGPISFLPRVQTSCLATSKGIGRLGASLRSPTPHPLGDLTGIAKSSFIICQMGYDLPSLSSSSSLAWGQVICSGPGSAQRTSSTGSTYPGPPATQPIPPHPRTPGIHSLVPD